ncbi:MAG: diguanylate cyclase [Acidobacteriota bacterium]|nr:diguanylate cyclase [Acidobacteriota bacterium]
MRQRRSLGPTLALAFCSAVAFGGQPIRFEHLTIDDGLSQNAVMAIHQDRQGFLWLGTENGLNRFDGYEFKVFTHDRQDPASIAGNYVWAIDEDAEGRLWVGTVGAGVGRFDPATERFTSYRHDPDRPTSLASDRVRTLHVGADGSVWVGLLESGLDRLDPLTGVVTHFRHDPADPATLANDSVYGLYTDAAGRLWIGTDGGLDRYDPERGAFEHHAHDAADASSLSDDRVRAIVEDRAGALWVGTWGGGLNRLDAGAAGFVRYRHDPEDPKSLGDDRVQSLLEDDAGRLFVGTASGLSGWDRELDGFSRYAHDPAQPHSLAGDHVMAIYQDRGGVVWFGTRTAGLSRWNPATWAFGHVTREPGNPRGLSNANVTSFAEDRTGRLWLGTFGGGLNVMNRVTGEVEHYREAAGAGGLTSDRVMALQLDHRGMLWIGTMGGGLDRMDPARGSVVSYRHDPARDDSLASDAVMTLFEDRAGVLWIGTFGGGLDRYERATDGFTHFVNDPADPASLGSDRVTSLADGPGDGLWVGTEGGGLNLLDRRTGTLRRFGHDPEDPQSLPSDVVYALHADGAGRLWIGTRGGGLARLTGSPEPGGAVAFRSFSSRDGLPDDDVYGIHSDADGNLWLSTNRGLARFDPRSWTSTNYDVSHGLQANEFHFGSHFASPSGELFFGGVNGFNAFFPGRLAANEHVPPVVLTAFLKLEQPVTEAGPAPALERIELEWRDDVVTFEFAALDFAAPERNRYAYMLEGFDADWIELGNVRRVTYTDLDGGDYVFRVRAANNDGVWNEEGLALDLEVAAPPWKTGWAYLAYVLAVLAAAFAFVHVQRRKLREEEEYSRRLEEEVELRTKEIAVHAKRLEQLNQQLVETSLTDSLTGLANRRFLFDWIRKEIAQLHREHAGPIPDEAFDLAFLMVDIDGFKSINDTCGHAAGDQVLLEVRTLLAEACRDSDLLIRWGGDEFLVVGRGATPANVTALAERIRGIVENHVFLVGGSQVVRTTASIGVACYPFLGGDLEALSWEQVVNVADVALYTAKRSGRNAWVGLFSTDETRLTGLLRTIREHPGDLVASGALEARTSLPDGCTLLWQPFRQEPSSQHPDLLSVAGPRELKQ